MKDEDARVEDAKEYPTLVGEKILHHAAKIIRTRGMEHGHTQKSFTLIAQLWTAYIQHASATRTDYALLPQDVAQMMVLLKMARSVYGFSTDNFTDSAGYTALAAMLDTRVQGAPNP